jgi:glycosyltransferase involved in cell wall biosynthesis
MKKKILDTIIYLGFNSLKGHKRGVENVIDFQSKGYDFKNKYYLHWGASTSSYRSARFICISIRHCWYWPFILNCILFQLNRKNRIFIHSHNPLFSLMSIYRTDLLTVHDGLYYHNKSMNKKLLSLFWIAEMVLYTRCTLIHFISVFSKSQTLFGNRTNYIIIPNTSHFEPLVTLSMVEETNTQKRTILIVRSIEERARLDLLLQVADRLREREYNFTVAGKGPLLEYYQNEIKKNKLDKIQMLGYVSDSELLNLYSTSEIVLVIAEYGEGFGLPILEGYLFNKPVIASNRCAIPEVIINKAFLFENNIEDILIKIDFAFSQKKINYRNYYFENYSNQKIIFQFNLLYKSLLTK